MSHKAENKCQWICNRRPMSGTCNNNCIGTYCSMHKQQLRRTGENKSQICRNCGIRGTRSITQLCLECGGQNAVHRICSKAYYWRKKHESSETPTCCT